MLNLCLVLPYRNADGPANMALDEALLDAAAEDSTRGYLRTYGWTVPTLSLGYFQHAAEADADPRWRGVPRVRRPTGGGALWHDREITYALALPRAHPLARDSRALYQAVHDAIAAELHDRGLAAARRGDVADGGPQPFLCFRGYAADDVIVRGQKLVGSAQRRRAGAVLQHGALLLARSPVTAELAGASDLAPVPADAASWREPLERGITAALGLSATPAEAPAALAQRARELEGSVYRNAEWTNRR